MSGSPPADVPQPTDINVKQKNETKLNKFLLWHPVVDGACRQSFYLPSAATLAAVRSAGSETPTKKTSDGALEGKNEKPPATPRPLTPMGSLLLRTEY